MSIHRNRPFHWHVCDPEGYVHYSTDDYDEAEAKADELAQSDLDIRKFWIDKCGHVPSDVHAPAKYNQRHVKRTGRGDTRAVRQIFKIF